MEEGNVIDHLFGLSPYRHWYNGKYQDNWEQTAKKIMLAAFFGSLVVAGCFIGALPFAMATSIGSAATLSAFVIVQLMTKPRFWKLSHQEAFKRMLENGKKAIIWHRQHGDSFAVDPELLFSREGELKDEGRKKIRFMHFPASAQGPRPEMEDEHFFAENRKYGTFLGVCDGHGGNETAQYSAARLRNEFFDELVANDENVYNTFHCLVNRIHKGAIRSRFHSGNTFTALYINKDAQPFIANVGDANTKLCRKISGVWHTIPFGRVVDWSDPEEAKRYAEISRDPFIAIDFARITDGKKLRYLGANVSRSLGDVDRCGPKGLPAIIHKVEVSTIPIRMQPGDRMISACDGLWDHLDGKEFDALLETHRSMKTLVPALVEKAVANMNKLSRERQETIGDNVTVVGLEAVTLYSPNAPVKRVQHMRHKTPDSILS